MAGDKGNCRSIFKQRNLVGFRTGQLSAIAAGGSQPWHLTSGLRVKRRFHPTQRTQSNAMTSLFDRPTADGSGQSQPPATTAYAAGTLPGCSRHAVKYEIIEIKFDLHYKLHNK